MIRYATITFTDGLIRCLEKVPANFAPKSSLIKVESYGITSTGGGRGVLTMRVSRRMGTKGNVPYDFRRAAVGAAKRSGTLAAPTLNVEAPCVR